MKSPRRPSHRLTFQDAVDVWKRYVSKHFVHRIASHFDCNIARIYEVIKGQLHPGSKEQAAAELDLVDAQLAAQLRAFVFKPSEPANDNQLDLFRDGAG